MKYIDAAVMAVALIIGYMLAVRLDAWHQNRK